MRTVDASIAGHLGDAYTTVYGLIELVGPSTTYRFTNAPIPLTWNGYTWTNVDFTTSELTADGDGEVTGSVTFEDVSRTIRALAFATDLNAFGIKVWELWVDGSNVPFGQDLLIEGSCDGVRCEGEDGDSPVATISVRGYFAASSQGIGPTQDYTLPCRYRQFKGPECKYAGAGTTCDRSYAQCTAYANTINFGGCRFALGPGEVVQWGTNEPAPMGERPVATYEPPPQPTGGTAPATPPRRRAVGH